MKELLAIQLLSNHDTWKLEGHRVTGPGFTNRCFKYCAPHLYNSLPKTIRHLQNIEIFKMKLKTYISSETFDIERNTICVCFVTLINWRPLYFFQQQILLFFFKSKCFTNVFHKCFLQSDLITLACEKNSR